MLCLLKEEGYCNIANGNALWLPVIWQVDCQT